MEDIKQTLREFKHEKFEKYDSNYRYNYAGFIENDVFGSYTRLYKYKLFFSPGKPPEYRLTEYLDNI